MTHQYHRRIDSIIKENYIHRLDGELKDTVDTKRIQMLKYLLLTEQSVVNYNNLYNDELQNHLKILKDEQYKKKWQFLNNDQKLNRLDEYFKRHNIGDIAVISDLKNNIIKLNTKHIKYDNVKSIITEITILTIADEKYKLTWIVDNKKTKENKSN